MYKIVFFVPVDAVERVKSAVFDAGAGQTGRYSRCSWQVLGDGQFLPENGANPAVGSVGSLEVLSEYRVELVCDDQHILAAIDALKSSHPYEEPAVDVWSLDERFL